MLELFVAIKQIHSILAAQVQGITQQNMFKQQIYSIDVYTANYLPPFINDLIRLLPNCFLLLVCVNITDSIGRFAMTQLRVGTRTLRWVYSYLTPSPSSVLL